MGIWNLLNPGQIWLNLGQILDDLVPICFPEENAFIGKDLIPTFRLEGEVYVGKDLVPIDDPAIEG